MTHELQFVRKLSHTWWVAVSSLQPQPKVRQTFQQKYWRGILTEAEPLFAAMRGALRGEEKKNSLAVLGER